VPDEFEEVMANSTAPNPVPFTLVGFEEGYARRLADYISLWVRYIGTRMNLERLDGITIAFDYPKALADLDRGYETTFVNKPTTEFAQGVAMSPVVKREGVIKTHIVLDAGVFSSFLDQKNENWRMLYYQLAHECGHVHDHYLFDLAFPGVFLSPPNFKTGLSRYVFEMGHSCWSEYVASRLSADFVPEQVVHFEETFFTVFENVEQRTDAIEDAFEADGDVIKPRARRSAVINRKPGLGEVANHIRPSSARERNGRQALRRKLAPAHNKPAAAELAVPARPRAMRRR
jgi:hypothetical protein